MTYLLAIISIPLSSIIIGLYYGSHLGAPTFSHVNEGDE